MISSKIESKDSSVQKANCINIIRNDYQEWAINVPADTAKVFELFFKEMDSIVKLKKCQKELIKEKILQKWQRGETGIISRVGGIKFYTLEISRTISDVLTENQYALYIKGRELNRRIVQYANDYLWVLYKLEGLSHEDSDIIKQLDKDIFHPN